MFKFFNIAAGIIAIFAGIYLAQLVSAGSNSMIQSLANGIGWYIIARGVYMISSSFQSEALSELLTKEP